MLELRTLGPAALRDPGGRDTETVLRQPKRLALLAYLAVATPRGFCRRDTLLGLFWPDLDEAHARNALGQTLHGLRTALGAGVLVSRGNAEVGLADQQLWCDAAAFAQAIDEGDRAGAMSLYRGDLLEGFFLTDAAEFERWLEGERSRLRRMAAEAAAWLAEDRGHAGETKAATGWAMRAVSLSPYDESALRRLVTLLDRSGDRAQALAVYERFTRRLATDLEVEPSPETQALIDGVRTRTETLTDVLAAPPVVTRPATADATRMVPQPSERGSDAPQPPPPGGRLRKAGAILTVGASTIVLVLAAAAWLGRDPPDEPAVDANVVMITPFRVAADGSFEYLREGLVDLLATRLNGETESRAVDARSAIAAWRAVAPDDRHDLPPGRAMAVARRLGAGRLLMGSVVGTADRLSLNVTLYDANDSTVRTRLSVQAPADSLLALVDGLAGQILARDAAVPPYQLESLTTTSLPALRAWLDGRSRYRRGHFGEAVVSLEEALHHDSTFALAASHLALAAGFGQLTAPPATRTRALRLAWAARDRLSEGDRLLVEALAGPRYPDPTPRHELHAARLRALEASPDQPEALALMAGFHIAGIVREEPRAEQLGLGLYRQALALDSTYAVAAYNLALAAAAARDDATVRRIVGSYLAADSVSEMAQLLQWFDAALGEAGAREALRARMPDMHPTALGFIAVYAILLGLDMDGGEAALAALGATVRSDDERRNHVGRELQFLANRGRFQEVWRELEERAREVETMGPIEPLGMSARERARWRRSLSWIPTALFWRADTTGVREAAAVAESVYPRSPTPDDDPYSRWAVAQSACFAGMANISLGEVGAARPAVARLQELVDSPVSLEDRPAHAACAAVLHALIAVAEGRSDARLLTERADSLLRAEPPSIRQVTNRVHLLLARAYDALDDHENALRVLRRRELNNPAFFLATFLAEEGRLAALVGDRDGAIRAYRHYLALRTDPDPELVPEVERVREELAALLSR